MLCRKMRGGQVLKPDYTDVEDRTLPNMKALETFAEMLTAKICRRDLVIDCT
jgi:hypothetical protein